MHPRVAHQETFLAAFAAGRDFLNFFDVRACLTQCDSLWRILRLFAAKNRGEPFRMKKAAEKNNGETRQAPRLTLGV